MDNIIACAACGDICDGEDWKCDLCGNDFCSSGCFNTLLHEDLDQIVIETEEDDE